MKLEQSLLVVAGIGGIAAFFLPFFTLETQVLGIKLAETSVSGYSLVRAALNHWDILPYEPGKLAFTALVEAWQQASQPKQFLQLGGLSLMVLGPVIYLLYSLGYLVRGLAGKQYQRGVWFNFLYMGLGWGYFFWISRDHSLQLLGQEIGPKLNFFTLASFGYWIAFASVMIAAFSLIFEPRSKASA
ncbi:MAG: hypothetical protein D6722_06090 [Bacteroidetes bacterium]|nr:MAG: hypothetical protein D6722_06090 [Bacteroidota bacterium]